MEVVLELLTAGGDLLQCTGEGVSPLHFAVQEGYSDVVSALLRAGARVDQIDNEGVTPLMRAPNMPCVRLLLDAGAIPNAMDADGFNALHFAGRRGGPAGVICSLFKAGCDPTALTNDGKTPADMARDEGEDNTAALLDRLAEEALIKSSK